jgi:hypothetical protein
VNPLIAPEVAVIVTCPPAVAFATPGPVVPVKVAAPPPESVVALQVTELVRICVLPSL